MQPLFLFKILGVPFFSYTTLIVFGIVLALAVALYIARRTSRNPTEVVEVFAWMVLPALLFGRAIHVLYNANYYIERPSELWRIADGGLALVGLVVGGGIGLWLWCWRRRNTFTRVLEQAALPLCIVAACGWIGAFLYGSQYGAPVDNLLALELRDTFGVISARWPTQMAAAALSVVLCVWLALRTFASRNLSGQRAHRVEANDVTGVRADGIMCLIVYAAGLFVLDFTRGDLSPMLAGLRLTQCLYLVSCGAAILYVARTRILRIGRT